MDCVWLLNQGHVSGLLVIHETSENCKNSEGQADSVGPSKRLSGFVTCRILQKMTSTWKDRGQWVGLGLSLYQWFKRASNIDNHMIV